jgi:hypothetical protein
LHASVFLVFSLKGCTFLYSDLQCMGSLLCSVCKLATKRTDIRVNTPMDKHVPIGEHLLCSGNDPWPMELNPLSFQLFSYDRMLAHKLLCWDIYTLRSQNELLCSFYLFFVFENFVVVFRYGCYLCPIFFKVFALGKGWGFWGFNNEPSQGMLCLVIGLFNQHSWSNSIGRCSHLDEPHSRGNAIA